MKNPAQRLSFVLPVLCLLAVSGCSKNKSSKAGAGAGETLQPVEVVTVERRDLSDRLSLVGTLAPRESAQLRPEIAGMVREILFTEGEVVKKGQLLMKIDDTELLAQRQEAEAAEDLAKANFERSQGLVTASGITKSEYDRALSEMKTSNAKLALIKSRLLKTEIRAPFDGTVGARSVSPGDYVTNDTVLTTVDDLSRLKIDFEVPERYLRKVSVGTVFSVTTRDADKEHETAGEVFFVSASINRDTRSSVIKGILTEHSGDLRPGMFANVELVLETRKGVTIVPESSILNSTKGTQLVLVDTSAKPPIAAFVPVKTGLRSGGVVEVSADVELANRSVVAAGVGALALYPGAKLSPRPAQKSLLKAAAE